MVVGGGSESREVFVVVKMEEIQHVCMPTGTNQRGQRSCCSRRQKRTAPLEVICRGGIRNIEVQTELAANRGMDSSFRETGGKAECWLQMLVSGQMSRQEVMAVPFWKFPSYQ